MAAKLKIAGTWSGILEVNLEEWTVTMLRQEIANQSNCKDPSTIKLIYTGRVLNDGLTTLSELGVKNNSKVLSSKVSIDEGKIFQQELLAEEQRASRLSRLKAAVESLAKRHADGSMPLEDYNIELENQRGEKVNMGSETDQRAIMMGMMLHAKGKQLIGAQQYKDALEVLQMGEEAFSLCDPKFLELVDNVAILQIDMVWCFFMLRDINLLSEAGERLAKARIGIERTHGKDGSRLRLLQNSRSPQLGLYLRMELLEGVAAFHSGDLKKASAALTSAKAKFSKLEVSDESLSLLMGMGYREHEARKALKLNEQDVESAINFLVDEREKKAKQRADDLKRQKEIMEQKKYGKTPLGKAVDIEILNAFVSISFDRELAAEALRIHENNGLKALDDLTNPETKSKLQNDIITRKRKRQKQTADRRISQLVSMGFERSRVTAAVNALGTTTRSLNGLLELMRQQDNVAPVSGFMSPPVDPAASSSAANTESPNAAASSSAVNPESPNAAASSSAVNPESPNAAASSSSVNPESPNAAASSSPLNPESPNADTDGSLPSSDDDNPSSSNGANARDWEMEHELADQLGGRDAFSDYDIDDVTKEAEALNEYLALLDSALDGGKPSSQ